MYYASDKILHFSFNISINRSSVLLLLSSLVHVLHTQTLPGHIKCSLPFEGKLNPGCPTERRNAKSGHVCARHPRSAKFLLWKCCQIHRLLSQVTAERRLRRCHPRPSRDHKVSADAWAISPLQLCVTLENSTVLSEMLRAIQFLM